MTPRRVQYSAKFHGALKALPKEAQEQVLRAIAHFINRTAENSLRIERKEGLLGVWAFRVNLDIRVFYVQKTDEKGRFAMIFHVGNHRDYKTTAKRRVVK